MDRRLAGLRTVGYACRKYQNEVLVDLPYRQLQCDEIWAFVGCKESVPNVSDARLRCLSRIGDAWTWSALDLSATEGSFGWS